MTDRYTSEDFNWLADLIVGRNVKIEHPTPTIVRPDATALTFAALRIASRVMADGVIEAALRVDGAMTGTALAGDIPAGMKATGVLSGRVVRAVLLA